MASARSIVDNLVSLGVIPAEFTDVAALELHRELMRRSRRVVMTLVALTSSAQLSAHSAVRLG